MSIARIICSHTNMLAQRSKGLGENENYEEKSAMFTFVYNDITVPGM